MRVKIAAQIEDDLLLEGVVQDDAQRVQAVLEEKRECRGENQRVQALGAVLREHLIDDELGDGREDDHHQRAEDRAGEGAEREQRVSFQVSKDSPGGGHARTSNVERPTSNAELRRTRRRIN